MRATWQRLRKSWFASRKPGRTRGTAVKDAQCSTSAGECQARYFPVRCRRPIFSDFQPAGQSVARQIAAASEC